MLELKVADFTMSPVYLAGSSLTKEQKGISLWFPWFIKEWTDKNPNECTDSRQIYEMYIA